MQLALNKPQVFKPQVFSAFALTPAQRKLMQRVLLLAAVAFVLFLLSSLDNTVWASDGTEFADAASKFDTWVKGNLGKLAALVSLAVGSVVAAVKKDWTWFFGSMVLAIGMGVMLSVINASFTATI